MESWAAQKDKLEVSNSRKPQPLVSWGPEARSIWQKLRPCKILGFLPSSLLQTPPGAWYWWSPARCQQTWKAKQQPRGTSFPVTQHRAGQGED